jgi:hypothetical protein
MHTSQNPSRSRSAFGRFGLLAERHQSFTPDEVRQRLGLEDTADSRTAAVHAAAARTGAWANLLSDKVAFDLGRAGNRLPTVVYWYTQGVPTSEIGRRLSPFGSAWDAERALGVAAALIARTLNHAETRVAAA